MLIGNYSVYLKSPGQWLGGNSTAANAHPKARAAWCQSGAFRSGTARAEDASLPLNSLPDGTEPPYSWKLATKGGALSAYLDVTGAGTVAANLLMGKDLSTTLIGSGDITAASLSLITSLVATIYAVGDLDGDLKSTINMAANLLGQGDVTASLGIIAWMVSTATGSGSISADLKGILSMAAELTSQGEALTTANVAASVWGAIASANNDAGTMGEKLNDAGAGGDPWAVDISTGYTGTEAGKVLTDVKRITKTNQALIAGK